jgi:hypothetical protein
MGSLLHHVFAPFPLVSLRQSVLQRDSVKRKFGLSFSFYVEGQAGSFVILFGAMQNQQENVSLECHDVRYLLITLHYYDSEKGSWCSWVYFIQYFRVSLSVNGPVLIRQASAWALPLRFF